MTFFLAILPILLLIIISLWKNVKLAVFVTLAVTTALFFFWDAPADYYFASLFTALISTVSILFIIFGAVFLYETMSSAGLIEDVSSSLESFHPSPNARFFFIAFFLTAFFEGIAGFGTPGTIVPLLLISMGFNAVLSIAIVLLFDGLFAMFGAVGTPVYAGLQLPLDLSDDSVTSIQQYSGLVTAIAGIIVVAFVLRFFKKEGYDPPIRMVIFMYILIALPMAVLGGFTGELTTIISAVFMGLMSYIFMGKKAPVNLKVYLPYLVLVVLLLIPKVIPELAEMLNRSISFDNILGTDLSAALTPLKSPLVPFLIATSTVFFIVPKEKRKNKLPLVLQRTGKVFLVLFPSVCISQLMLNSGAEQPSMINVIASVTGKMGDSYVLVAPFLGILGAFISGSTTVSNLIFGGAQLQTAEVLGLSPDLILAEQLTGASLGNAICLFNIIAAASIADISNYNRILKLNLAPVLLAGLIAGITGLLLS